VDVEQKNVDGGPVLSEEDHRFGAIGREPDGEPADPCHGTHDGAQSRVVIDDQNALRPERTG
jgi:hypothetical protein